MTYRGAQPTPDKEMARRTSRSDHFRKRASAQRRNDAAAAMPYWRRLLLTRQAAFGRSMSGRNDVNLRKFSHDPSEKQASAKQLYLLLTWFQVERFVKLE